MVGRHAGTALDGRPDAMWPAVLGAGAAVSGARVLLLHTGHAGPSADLLGIAHCATVGVAAVSALLLLGELRALVGRCAPRDGVDRLSIGLCLTTVVVLGVLVPGGPDDEAALTAVLAAQLLILAAALLPPAVATRAVALRAVVPPAVEHDGR